MNLSVNEASVTRFGLTASVVYDNLDRVKKPLTWNALRHAFDCMPEEDLKSAVFSLLERGVLTMEKAGEK